MKRILIYVCLCIATNACAPAVRTSIPIVQISLTEVAPQLPTSTTIPNTPEQIIEATSSPMPTPTEDPNSLNYKNEAGKKVAVELSMHEYTNKAGQTVDVPEITNKDVWAYALSVTAEGK